MNEDVRTYWNRRAATSATPLAATTQDVWLRELEARTLVTTLRGLSLPHGARVVDLGCGDGRTTLRLAEACPHLQFVGVDYSENMIGLAQDALEAERSQDPPLLTRAEFRVGDVTRLDRCLGDEHFDVAITVRCLINLDSDEAQYAAIAGIAEHIGAGGYYVAIENFIEGHNNMNAARRTFGVPEIPVRWHNTYFVERDFERRCARHFADMHIDDFASAYYFATRVVYSAMCRINDEEPDYDHEIHRRAIDLPSFGRFSPIRLALMRRRPGPP